VTIDASLVHPQLAASGKVASRIEIVQKIEEGDEIQQLRSIKFWASDAHLGHFLGHERGVIP
jgi:hypothetical protein